MMLGCVAEIVVVFVPPFAVLPDVPAIGTWQLVRVATSSVPDLDIDPLSSLHAVSVARRFRGWTWSSGQRVYSEWHGVSV